MLKTEAIVLREHKYGETSKILKVYSRDRGSVSIMVRGAYNPKSRLIANTQVFSLNNYQLRQGKNFYFIEAADLVDSYYGLREDIEKMAIGYYMLELVDKSMAEEDANSQIFELLKKGLAVLETLDSAYLRFLLAYELKYISFLGYRPYVRDCVSCFSKLGDELGFSLVKGGIICKDCLKTDHKHYAISPRVYTLMLSLLYSPLDGLEAIEATKEDISYLHRIMVNYILLNIDRTRFNSLDMLSSFNY